MENQRLVKEEPSAESNWNPERGTTSVRKFPRFHVAPSILRYHHTLGFDDSMASGTPVVLQLGHVRLSDSFSGTFSGQVIVAPCLGVCSDESHTQIFLLRKSVRSFRAQ